MTITWLTANQFLPKLSCIVIIHHLTKIGVKFNNNSDAMEATAIYLRIQILYLELDNSEPVFCVTLSDNNDTQMY